MVAKKDNVIQINQYHDLGSVLNELNRAFREGKILDIALTFRRKLFDGEDDKSEDGRNILSVTHRHWHCSEFVYMVLGMIESLKDYVKECDEEYNVRGE